jgi:hypothetical protein
MGKEQNRPSELEGAPSLVAILLAARATHDRDLERAAKNQLSEKHGIEVTFRRRREASNAN